MLKFFGIMFFLFGVDVAFLSKKTKYLCLITNTLIASFVNIY